MERRTHSLITKGDITSGTVTLKAPMKSSLATGSPHIRDVNYMPLLRLRTGEDICQDP